MLRIGHLVVNIVARKEVHRLVDREVQCLVRWITRNRRGEGETLPQRGAAGAVAERLLKQDRYRRCPIQAEGSVSHFVEEVQILDGGVVDAEGRADTGLARAAKDLAQDAVGESRRVGQADSRSKVVVPGRSERLGNARVSREYQALGRTREDSG